MKIGTSSQGTGIISPMAVGEFLKTPVIGNAGNRTSLKIQGLAPGNYYWAVQAIDQSFQASGFTMEADLVITGLEGDIRDEGFRIYPNPFSDICRIEVPDPGMYHIMITDITGKMVLECNRYIANRSAEINTSELAEGCYILQVGSEGKLQRSKIVKQ